MAAYFGQPTERCVHQAQGGTGFSVPSPQGATGLPVPFLSVRDSATPQYPPTHSAPPPLLAHLPRLFSHVARIIGIQTPSGYDVVRIALALLLLTAAALKGHQLATEPVPGDSLLTSRWFLISVVEFELLFGLWLLAGLSPAWTWQAALLCFSAFAGVSLLKAISGEATCGCFGRVPVNPWYTFALDTAAVIALLSAPPRGRVAQQHEPGFSQNLPRLAMVAMLAASLGIPAAIAMGRFSGADLIDSGELLGDSRIVVLQPETWIGRRCPLLKYVDIGEQLSDGEWLAVLYHHGCPKCRQRIPQYVHLSDDLSRRPESVGFALIELPPYDTRPPGLRIGASSCALGRLSDVREWFVATPLELTLNHGTVVRVAKYE